MLREGSETSSGGSLAGMVKKTFWSRREQRKRILTRTTFLRTIQTVATHSSVMASSLGRTMIS